MVDQFKDRAADPLEKGAGSAKNSQDAWRIKAIAEILKNPQA